MLGVGEKEEWEIWSLVPVALKGSKMTWPLDHQDSIMKW